MPGDGRVPVLEVTAGRVATGAVPTAPSSPPSAARVGGFSCEHRSQTPALFRFPTPISGCWSVVRGPVIPKKLPDEAVERLRSLAGRGWRPLELSREFDITVRHV